MILILIQLQSFSFLDFLECVWYSIKHITNLPCIYLLTRSKAKKSKYWFFSKDFFRFFDDFDTNTPSILFSFAMFEVDIMIYQLQQPSVQQLLSTSLESQKIEKSVFLKNSFFRGFDIIASLDFFHFCNIIRNYYGALNGVLSAMNAILVSRNLRNSEIEKIDFFDEISHILFMGHLMQKLIPGINSKSYFTPTSFFGARKTFSIKITEG